MSAPIPLADRVGRSMGAGLAAVLGRRAVLGLTVTLAGVVLLVSSPGARLLLALSVSGLAVLVLWRLTARGSFDRWVGWPLRSARRKRRVYGARWDTTMDAVGLASKREGVQHLPRLRSVRSTSMVDEVTVAALVGQVPADYAAVADRLAQTFGARECRVSVDPRRTGRVVLRFLVADPLRASVAPFPPSGSPDLAGLPVAIGEDAAVWRLRLLGTHLLLVGATSAGKSSVVWAILHTLAPAIGTGQAQVWVIDPKGGMELAAGKRLFTRFCHGDTTEGETSHELAYAQTLEDTVAVMRERQARLRGVARLHTPTTGDPLIVLVVDELAALTSYVTDREAKKRISAALSLLLSQGRAVGVTVVAALQDPRKEVLPTRDLFPTRVGLRMTDPDQVDMVLGAGARNRGAACDQIPESLPGVGYVALDGVAEPARVRFAYLSDADIAAMVDTHASADPATESEGVAG